MKLSPILLLVTCLVARAETEEQLSKRFAVQPGGKLIVDVDFGAIDVSTNATGEVIVEVVRKVTRDTKQEEEAYLADRPVTFSQDGNTVTIRRRRRAKATDRRAAVSAQKKCTITVPAQFSAQLRTAGGAITVNDLTGDVNATTSGGKLQFARLHGALNGRTSGGAIEVVDGDGTQQVKTDGGGINVSGGAGSFAGKTSGGSVTVKDFRGAVQVKSTGGGITVENVAGKLEGKTSGGSISARFASPPSEEVKLATSGGGVTLRVPENSAFDLDASTSGGRVNSDLAVSARASPPAIT
jgi:hypothetical protein